MLQVLRKSSMVLVLIVLCFGCTANFEPGTFGNDLEILNNVDYIHVLTTGDSRVAVSGELQGRVFTSSSQGLNGKSYGWFRRDAIIDGTFKNKFSNLGGEDRMWFGPQYGKFNVFFEPKSTFEDEKMRIAPDLDTLSFKVINTTEKEVESVARMQIKNYQDYVFDIDVARKVSIFDRKEIENNLGVSIDEKVSYVGFETATKIKNVGADTWSKDTGLISIWILGCILPTDSTVAIIPTRGDIDRVTNYFTPLDDSRMQIKDGIVYYKADANYLNKIGVLPQNTLPVFGSYSPELKLLTIVQFTFSDDISYMNSEKTEQIDPYGGDVINIFNDGVTGTAGPFGPFYELETSSSAKELEVGEELIHTSATYHFEGDEESLDRIAQGVLGVRISDRVRF